MSEEKESASISRAAFNSVRVSAMSPSSSATPAAYRRCWDFNQANPSGSPVLAWPGAREGEPLRTRTRDSAWPLPSGEPVVRVVGQAGGISLDHIEPDPSRQPAVPEVVFEMPPCPLCGDDLEGDGDGFSCQRCRASWGRDGRSGSWDEPNAPRCPAKVRSLPNHQPDLIEQCVYADMHDPDHRTEDGITTWTDRDDRAVVDATGEPT